MKKKGSIKPIIKTTAISFPTNDFVKRLNAKVIVEEDVKDEEQLEDNEKYDYIVDLKAKSATLTQKGIKKAEQAFNLENFNDLEKFFFETYKGGESQN